MLSWHESDGSPRQFNNNEFVLLTPNNQVPETAFRLQSPGKETGRESMLSIETMPAPIKLDNLTYPVSRENSHKQSPR